MWRQFNNLFAPITDLPTDGGLSTLDLLNDDDKEVIDLDEGKKEDKEEIKEEKEEKEEKKEPDELEELEEELKEPDEEKLELTIHSSKREILKVYPDLFKKFPSLERAYYRDQQYTELLPTIQDARKAVQDSDTLNNVEKDLMSGNTEKLLLAAKQENPRAFYKIVDNYLDVLGKVDAQARDHVFGNVVKQTIVAMVKEARASKNDTLQSAAAIVNQFVFGSSEFVPSTKLSSDEKEETKNNEIQNEREQFLNEKFESAHDDLNSRVNNTIKSTIEQNIDPKDSMSEYIKKNATRAALEQVNELIEKDNRFRIIVDKLWANARANGYKKEHTDKIRQAFLSKAKTLLPTVIKSARNEALKGISKRVQDDSDEPIVEESRERSTIPVRKNNSGSVKNAKDIPKGMKTLDFLMQD